MRNKASHRAAFRRRGAMLLLALFFIAVSGSMAGLVMSNASQLVRTTRSEHEELIIRQLTDSGRAWVLARGGLPRGGEVRLGGDGIVPEGTKAEVRLAWDEQMPGVIAITAQTAFPRHRQERTTRFRLP